MGRYITPDELFFKYPSLAKLGAGNKSTVDSYFIAPAEDFLDGRLAGSFGTPFSTSYPIIKELTQMVIYFTAMANRDNKKSKAIEAIFDKRIKLILAGELAITDGTDSEEIQEIWSNVDGYHPVHSMLGAEDELTEISSERLSDEEDERS